MWILGHCRGRTLKKITSPTAFASLLRKKKKVLPNIIGFLRGFNKTIVFKKARDTTNDNLFLMVYIIYWMFEWLQFMFWLSPTSIMAFRGGFGGIRGWALTRVVMPLRKKNLSLPSSFPLSSPLPILPLHLQAPNKAPENHTVKTGTHKQRGGASPELNQMGILAASNSWNQKSEEILF